MKLKALHFVEVECAYITQQNNTLINMKIIISQPAFPTGHGVNYWVHLRDVHYWNVPPIESNLHPLLSHRFRCPRANDGRIIIVAYITTVYRDSNHRHNQYIYSQLIVHLPAIVQHTPHDSKRHFRSGSIKKIAAEVVVEAAVNAAGAWLTRKR
ncbi:unnamed protein product [Ceratitis capitata]|uniref:(Mediterranean fruit fly) hypothetical protein n=1 Tax=Ceratitis capitata TaxID=7213 RepID=A0A811U9X4_CERCA|nr:unnamed protein product [Ceratitis capitata]